MRRKLSKALIFLTISALSITLLSGCDNSGTTESSSMTENVVSEDVVEENGSQQSVTEEVNQESSQEVSSESTQESQEKHEESTEETSNQDGVQSLQDDSTHQEETGQSTEQAHTHTWVTETRYRTVHHDAVYENQTIIDQAAWDETVVDQAAWDETTYTTEEQQVWHDGEEIKVYEFDDGTQIPTSNPSAIEAYINAHPELGYGVRWITTDGYWTTETVQVPHVVHHDAVTHVVHHDAVTHVEKVMVKEAYDEQVPYTVTVCSECGKEK